MNTVFSVVTYSLKNFEFDNQQLKSDFANLPLSIFGGGIICAICAWAGGGMGLARVQKKEQCLTSFVCYMACIACCATSIWIQIHGAQGKLPLKTSLYWSEHKWELHLLINRKLWAFEPRSEFSWWNLLNFKVWRQKVMGQVILFSATFQSVSLILVAIFCFEAARYLWSILTDHFPLCIVCIISLIVSGRTKILNFLLTGQN